MADVIDKEQNAPIRILELDCGMGANLCYLQHRFPESVCAGIDRSPLAVGLGRRAADLRYGDCETFAFPWRKHSFDYIFAVDALGRAADKASFTGKLANYLKEGGWERKDLSEREKSVICAATVTGKAEPVPLQSVTGKGEIHLWLPVMKRRILFLIAWHPTAFWRGSRSRICDSRTGRFPAPGAPHK